VFKSPSDTQTEKFPLTRHRSNTQAGWPSGPAACTPAGRRGASPRGGGHDDPLIAPLIPRVPGLAAASTSLSQPGQPCSSGVRDAGHCG
jgi:hypothetical protein